MGEGRVRERGNDAIDVDIVHQGIGEVLITSMLLRPFCSASGGGVARGAMARMISRGAS